MANKQLESKISDLEKQIAARRLAVTTVLIVVRDVASDGQPVQKKPYDPADFDISQQNGYEVWWPKGEGHGNQ